MTRWTEQQMRAAGLLARVRTPVPIDAPRETPVLLQPTGRQKYGNVPVDGFDSTKEAKAYQTLVMLQRCGQITDLKTQVRFELIPANADERGAFYTADFTYRDAFGQLVVADVKGDYRDDAWVLRRKLMRHVHGIVVKIL